MQLRKLGFFMSAQAFYRCELKVHSRSDGANAVGRAAYRSGLNLDCERTGERFYFAHRSDVLSTQIFSPAGFPEPLKTPTALWNAAEYADTRKNSRVARELILGLPHQLSLPQMIGAVGMISRWLVKRYQVAVMANIHDAKPESPKGFHAHVLFSTRRATTTGFGEKTRELDAKGSGERETKKIRRAWGRVLNVIAESISAPWRVTHKSLEDRGSNKLPTKPLGLKASALEKAGQNTEEGDYNRMVAKINLAQKHLARQIEIDRIRGERESARAVADQLAKAKLQEQNRRAVAALYEAGKVDQPVTVIDANTGHFDVEQAGDLGTQKAPNLKPLQKKSGPEIPGI